MLDLKQFSQAVQQIADEKSIPKEKIFETIEMALALRISAITANVVKLSVPKWIMQAAKSM